MRFRDSSARRRRRSLAGLTLMLAGLAIVIVSVVAGSSTQPEAITLDPDGTVDVPATRFYQNAWVLFANIDDPRRVPSVDEIGCRPTGDLSLADQPVDMTQYGSRVVDGESVSAASLFGRSGSDASILCSGAGEFEPLRLASASPAPAFTPTAIGIIGVLFLIAAALVHPGTAEIGSRGRNREWRDPA